MRGESQSKGGVQMRVAESLGAVHTHTHTHVLTNVRYLLCLQCNGGIRLLDRAEV